MASKPKEEVIDIVTAPEEIFDAGTMLAVAGATRGHIIPIETAQALAILEDGEVPPDVIRTRQGYPKAIEYIDHVWGTKTMNHGFRWLWDFECLEYTVFEDDGSVASRNQLTVHIPVKFAPDGSVLEYHKRVVTEIGAFEAYQKKANGQPVFDTRGFPVYTMATADRVASSVSRGLMKAMFRMFNIGAQLMDSADPTMTNKDAWNLLLRFGQNQGLTEEVIADTIKEAGITSKELVDKFQECYTLLYNKAKGLIQKEVPFD